MRHVRSIVLALFGLAGMILIGVLHADIWWTPVYSLCVVAYFVGSFSLMRLLLSTPRWRR